MDWTSRHHSAIREAPQAMYPHNVLTKDITPLKVMVFFPTLYAEFFLQFLTSFCRMAFSPHFGWQHFKDWHKAPSQRVVTQTALPFWWGAGLPNPLLNRGGPTPNHQPLVSNPGPGGWAGPGRAFSWAPPPRGHSCHGGWLPITAGIVKGRRVTGFRAIKAYAVLCLSPWPWPWLGMRIWFSRRFWASPPCGGRGVKSAFLRACP